MFATYIYTRIARPEEEHGVSTPDEYVRFFLVEALRRRKARPSPHIRWPELHVVEGMPIVRQGRWLVACACGNYPSYDPEWRLAICLDCAAVYRCAPPSQWPEVEATLMRRPDPMTRNMEVGETIVGLRLENDAHGLGEGA